MRSTLLNFSVGNFGDIASSAVRQQHAISATSMTTTLSSLSAAHALPKFSDVRFHRNSATCALAAPQRRKPWQQLSDMQTLPQQISDMRFCSNRAMCVSAAIPRHKQQRQRQRFVRPLQQPWQTSPTPQSQRKFGFSFSAVSASLQRSISISFSFSISPVSASASVRIQLQPCVAFEMEGEEIVDHAHALSSHPSRELQNLLKV